MLLMQRVGRELGIPGQVALEQQMACGLGMCFCCVRKFRSHAGIVNRRVCWDGPVFPLQEALSW
jgi:dihydroorotate dehydrogenase electron transfer subunit